MTPQDFIRKWRGVELNERAAAQAHFLDLCRLLDVEDPISADRNGDWFTFEKGAKKAGGGDGWADVWRKGHFGWEYKGPGKNLDKAFEQLLRYSVALDNPPLLVVSDTDRIRVHTNWTNTVHQVHEIDLEDLTSPEARAKLKAVFTDPEKLKPGRTRQALTEDAAERFVALADRLRSRGHEATQVAHFVNRLVFCMFAEDVDLLPDNLFQRALESAAKRPERVEKFLSGIFAAMKDGGVFGIDEVPWFNGGLFDDAAVLPLEKDDVVDIAEAARLDWSEIDPSILGTLFERGLDPDKRSQLGAHYTDADKIKQIVDPVIVEPLTREWETAKAGIEADMDAARNHPNAAQRGKAWRRAASTHAAFTERLKNYRVLDPACGSGNFLYVVLRELKDIEHRANLDAEALGLMVPFPSVGPECVRGIELNPFAAELARVSIWIGEIQWMRRHGFDVARSPILKPLDTIECRDALLNTDGTRAEWPEADVIVGNPPFIGNKRLRGRLGDEYVTRLRAAWPEVSSGADLVTYWFAKAWALVSTGRVARAGLVATNSIRGGSNRETLKAITGHGRIFDAWSDEPWTVDGVAVRVSMVCFDDGSDTGRGARLDGRLVGEVYSDLTAGGAGGATVDLTCARRLPENGGVAFMGDTKGGAFDVSGEQAREWLALPRNPNGRPNSDVLRPWMNGMDVTRRPSGKWIIDFGWEMTEPDAALYEAPFRHVVQNVKPMRDENRREAYRRLWWVHVEPRPAMWNRLVSLNRYIVTPTVAKHRMFVWLQASICPDHQLIVVARDDDTTFGILHSRFHEVWSLRMGTSLEDRPRYTPSTTFETFPFPEGLTPDIPAEDYADDPRAVAIADAARRLNELRGNWLNPADLVERVPEVVEGYPDRLEPVSEVAAKELKKRTLTNLYNDPPQWLVNAHRELNRAVAAAYGWPEDIEDDDALARLFVLNQERAAGRG